MPRTIPERPDTGQITFLYDPWTRRKMDEQTVCPRATATRVVPEDFLSFWVHDDDDVERTPIDESRN